MAAKLWAISVLVVTHAAILSSLATGQVTTEFYPPMDWSDPPTDWNMSLDYFDPYECEPASKSCSEIVFSPYLDVNGKCRFLPLAASLAIDRGYELPLPFGVATTYTYLQASPVVNEVKIGFNGGVPTSVPLQVDNVNHKTHNLLARVDGWLFPFLNVYGLFGENYLTATGDVTIPNPFPIGSDLRIPIDISTNGPVYGVGAILAVGYQDWFLTLDTNYTRTDLDLFDSTIEKGTSSFRTGFRSDVLHMKIAYWIGTMYIDRKTFLEGTVQTGTTLDPVKFNVESEFEQPWNVLLGSVLEFSPAFNITLELGLGDREQLTTAAMYRF